MKKLHNLNYKKSTRKITKSPLTDKRHKIFLKGVIISIILIITPFLFYIYRFAPKADVWDLGFITIGSGGFKTIVGFSHAFFTKITFVLITSIWFFTAKQWWRYAILVPVTMFLFQLTGVINHKIEYIDNYDFWYSIPVVLPIVIFMILVSLKINKQSKLLDIRETIQNEIEAIKLQKK
jgi:magnesium-transporting ATPase (P-type)